MAREMKHITVYVNEAGNVTIEQKGVVGDHPDQVVITPDQVDLVVQWLQEARDEAAARANKRASRESPRS